jgi:hypothetical protein
MAKFEEVLGKLTEDEKLAFEILAKNGWLPFVDVQVEKAIIEGVKYQTYSAAGYYDIGILKAEIGSVPEKKTAAKGKKKGR